MIAIIPHSSPWAPAFGVMAGIGRTANYANETALNSTTTNYSGGIQGGISNGEDIYFRVAFKPTATITQAQQTVNRDHQAVTLEARGRHDPCVGIRATPIAEALLALVVMDHALRHRAQCGDVQVAMPAIPGHIA